MAPAARPEHDSGLPQPARFWTVAEANGRIADLAELLPRLKGWAARLSEVHDELKRLSEFWGSEVDSADHADHDLKARLDAEWQNLTRRLEEAVAALRAEAIEVKNLDTGLVDFYSLQNSEVVFLCWQRGEPEVAYFHPLAGGYATRRPIPSSGPGTPRPSPARGAPG